MTDSLRHVARRLRHDEEHRRRAARVVAPGSVAVLRARDYADQLTTAGSLADAEEAVLQRLAELRQVVIEGAGQAAELNALRTILKQLFHRVLLLSADHPWLKLDEVRDAAATLPGLVLLPCLREDVVTMAEDGRTLFDRAVLPLAETAYDGLPSAWVIARIAGRTG